MSTPNLVALFDGDPWVRVEIVDPPLVLGLEWAEIVACAAYALLWDHQVSPIPGQRYHLPPDADLGPEAGRHGLQIVATWGPSVATSEHH